MQGQAIYRYEVPVNDATYRYSVGQIVSVGCRQLEVVEFWAITDPSATERAFTVVGTGHRLPEGFIAVHGTAFDYGGKLVWHLIEVTP